MCVDLLGMHHWVSYLENPYTPNLRDITCVARNLVGNSLCWFAQIMVFDIFYFGSQLGKPYAILVLCEQFHK